MRCGCSHRCLRFVKEGGRAMTESVEKQRMNEVVKVLESLGFRTNTVKLYMLDDIRGKVYYDNNMYLGIYDFVKHTFVD